MEAINSLRQFPNRGRDARRNGWRELVVGFGRGAYILRYQVRGDEVLVVGIRHSRERR